MDFRERFDDPLATQQCALDGRQAQIWTTCVGFVTKVNLPIAMTVEVQPAIMGKQAFPDGSLQHVLMPVIPDVPIVFPSAGGYTLTFPIAVGDECELHIHSRAIDSWWESGTVSVPSHARMHDITDATAYFGPKSKPNLVGNISLVSVQLRSDDGTVVLDLNQATGTMTLTSPTAIQLNAPTVGIEGELIVTGEVTAQAAGASIKLSVHQHGTGTPAAGTTVPTPGS